MNKSLSTFQRKHESSFIHINSQDILRLYEDANLNNTHSLESLHEIRSSLSHLQPDIENYYYLEREALMADYYKRYALLQEYMNKNNGVQGPENQVVIQHRFNLDLGNLSLHYYGFQPIVEMLASDQQKKKWLPLIYRLQITGAYAQTELGHGSDIQNLQTTATYDKSTNEFVFNTPSIKAIKFWPGGLGKTANHAVVFARLITEEKDHGVQAFIVQIRDQQTHKSLHGVEVGDIGPKLGYAANDNGYLQFNQFRQPRDSLLSRYVSITEEGQFQKVPNSTKLAYGGMLNLRIGISFLSHYHLARMSAIGLRYSYLRKQFELDKSKEETQIIQYQMQQHKIIPAIATSWTLLFASNYLYSQFIEYQKLLAQKGIKDKEVFNLLSNLHGFAAGVKAVGTQLVELFGEQIKQACGGHGYLHSAGLSRLHIDAGIGNATAEGDSMVLLQQTAMIILKNVQDGVIDTDQLYYELNDKLSIEQTIVTLYEIRYKGELRNLQSKIVELMGKGKNLKTEIWNDHCLMDLVNTARYYTFHFMVQNFYEILFNQRKLTRLDTTMNQRSEQVNKVMRSMFKVFSLYYIIEDFNSFYVQFLPEHVTFFLGKRIDELKDIYKHEMLWLSVNGKEIVDGFGYSDDELLSVIGAKSLQNEDQLYEQIMRVVRKNPLNEKPVTKGFNQYMRPILQGKL